MSRFLRKVTALSAMAALLSTAILAAEVSAFTTLGVKSQFHNQTYFINPNFTDIRSGTQAQQITAMQNGATDWNNQADYLWTYGGQTAVNFVNNADGVNAIYYAGAGSNDTQFGALAICFLSFDGNNFITGFDIEYYDKSGTTMNDFLYYGQGGAPPGTDFDIWSIATHEFGHALGMGHTNLADNTVSMFAQTAPGNITHRTLHADDQAGIIAIYGNGPFVPKFAGAAAACGPPQNANVGAVTALTGAWRITNTGNVADSFNYNLVDNAGWLNFIPPGTTPLLQPGGVFTLPQQPTVTIPPPTPNGTVDNLTWTATSVGNPAVAAACITQVTAVQPAYVPGAMMGGQPAGLAWDQLNNLYVAVHTAGTIVRVPPGGGAAIPIVLGLANPTGLVLGPNGNLFVTDFTGGVFEYTVGGALVKVVANPGTFLMPMDLAFCGNDLLVADAGFKNVYALPGAAFGPPTPINKVFYSGPYPDLFGIVLDMAGNLLATGGTTGNIFKTPNGATMPVVWGTTVGGYAMGIAMDQAGHVYVAEGQVGADIDYFNPGGGVPVATIPASTSGWTWIAFSQAMQVHPPLFADTFLFTSNTGNVGPPNACAGNVCQFNVVGLPGAFNGLLLPSTANCPVGPQPVVYATQPVIPGQGPSGLAFVPGGSGHLYVADQPTGQIHRVMPGGGAAVPVIGGLVNPRGIAFGPNNNLYVLEGNGAIGEYTMPGAFIQLICPPGTFADPVDLAFCGGDLFVTDRAARTLYVVPNAVNGPNNAHVYQAGFPDLFGVAIHPLTFQIYVTLNSLPQVAVMNGPNAGFTVVATDPSALSMQGISFDRNGGFYVADGVGGVMDAFNAGGGLPSMTAMNAVSGETWVVHGFGVLMPGMMEREVYYSSTGIGGPANACRLNVCRLDFMTQPGAMRPNMACGGTSGVSEPSIDQLFGNRPLVTEILQNSPNPFNPVTSIFYAVERAGAVRLSIYDLAGRSIKTLVNEAKDRGRYAVLWDGTDDGGRAAGSGLYFYTLESGGGRVTKKMMLAK